MTKPYTPELIDLKVNYCTALDPGFAHKAMANAGVAMATGHASDFDRAIAKHDAETLDEKLNLPRMATLMHEKDLETGTTLDWELYIQYAEAIREGLMKEKP